LDTAERGFTGLRDRSETIRTSLEEVSRRVYGPGPRPTPGQLDQQLRDADTQLDAFNEEFRRFQVDLRPLLADIVNDPGSYPPDTLLKLTGLHNDALKPFDAARFIVDDLRLVPTSQGPHHPQIWPSLLIIGGTGFGLLALGGGWWIRRDAPNRTALHRGLFNLGAVFLVSTTGATADLTAKFWANVLLPLDTFIYHPFNQLTAAELALLATGAAVIALVGAIAATRSKAAIPGAGLLIGGGLADVLDTIPDNTVTDFVPLALSNPADLMIILGAGTLIYVLGRYAWAVTAKPQVPAEFEPRPSQRGARAAAGAAVASAFAAVAVAGRALVGWTRTPRSNLSPEHNQARLNTVVFNALRWAAAGVLIGGAVAAVGLDARAALVAVIVAATIRILAQAWSGRGLPPRQRLTVLGAAVPALLLNTGGALLGVGWGTDVWGLVFGVPLWDLGNALGTALFGGSTMMAVSGDLGRRPHDPNQHYLSQFDRAEAAIRPGGGWLAGRVRAAATWLGGAIGGVLGAVSPRARAALVFAAVRATVLWPGAPAGAAEPRGPPVVTSAVKVQLVSQPALVAAHADVVQLDDQGRQVLHSAAVIGGVGGDGSTPPQAGAVADVTLTDAQDRVLLWGKAALAGAGFLRPLHGGELALLPRGPPPPGVNLRSLDTVAAASPLAGTDLADAVQHVLGYGWPNLASPGTGTVVATRMVNGPARAADSGRDGQAWGPHRDRRRWAGLPPGLDTPVMTLVVGNPAARLLPNVQRPDRAARADSVAAAGLTPVTTPAHPAGLAVAVPNELKLILGKGDVFDALTRNHPGVPGPTWLRRPAGWPPLAASQTPLAVGQVPAAGPEAGGAEVIGSARDPPSLPSPPADMSKFQAQLGEDHRDS